MRIGPSRTRAAGIAFGVAAAVLIARTPLSAQSFTFTAPAAGAEWQAGTTQAIAWTIKAPTVAMGRMPVKLYFRTLPDGAWNDIGETDAFQQKFQWAVPADVSGRLVIRAMWGSPAVVAVESPAFTVTSRPAAREPFKSPPRASGSRSSSVSDYRIESVVFGDGRELSEGVLYQPDGPNLMRLRVTIHWNGMPGRYGAQCERHTVNVDDLQERSVLGTARVPAPDGGGRMTIPVSVPLPGGHSPGSEYRFRVRFQPAAAGCDAQATNNATTLRTRLMPMAGHDLVVRIVDLRTIYNQHTRANDLLIGYEVMNPSGTETIKTVTVSFELRDVPAFGTHVDQIANLRPGVWHRAETRFVARDATGIRGEQVLVATVDAMNWITELREDNNTDGRRFRW